MKMRFLHCIAGAACFFAFRSSVFAADAAPIDFRKALTTLKNIKEKHNTEEKTMQSKVVQDLRTASASNATAIAFYQDAVAATQFGSKDSPGFQQWMSKEADNLHSDAMQNAARLHINYLILSIQRSLGATTRQLEQPLLNHIAALTAAGARDSAIQLDHDKATAAKDAAGKNPPSRNRKPSANHEPLFRDQDLITQDITSSIFVKWYGVSQMLAGLKDWETVPGNIEGMYESTLLPYFRQIKDPRVIAYWDDKIQQESLRANARVAFKLDQFNNVRRPQLLWRKAVDTVAIGQRNRGMGEMLELIKNTPNHPDLPDWIAQLEKMIGGASAEAAAAATPAVPKPVDPQPTLPVPDGTPTAN